MDPLHAYKHSAAITPSDSAPPANPQMWEAVYSGVGGDITLVTEGGETVLLKSTPAATVVPIRTNWVKATGTAATNLLGLWS